jgi:hypothetical protein
MSATRKILFATVASAVLGVTVWVLTSQHEARGPRLAGARKTPDHAGSPQAAVKAGTEDAGVGASIPGGPANQIDLVAEICGPEAGKRLDELERRGALSQHECDALYSFLRQKTADDRMIHRMASIKNSVMNILARQPAVSSEWAQMLQRIYDDAGQHWVIRDYALQHLFEYWHEAATGANLATWGVDQHGKAQEIFWRALEHRNQSVAGTALLALWNLSQAGVAIDRAAMAKESLALLEPGQSGELTRITALQICALLGERGALATATVAARDRANVALRVSAIGAIGQLGSAGELAILREFATENHPGIRAAVEAALKRIQSRSRI